MPARQQKITFAEMRAAGVRGLLVYCSDYQCSHRVAISGDPNSKVVLTAPDFGRILPLGRQGTPYGHRGAILHRGRCFELLAHRRNGLALMS
jgi:hypothetical protein